MKQTQKILNLLKHGNWICGTKFMEAYIPEYRSRINEIRKKGQLIEARRCQ